MSQLGCVSEVCQLDCTLRVDQNVVRLDISVEDVLRVEEGEALEGLVKDIGADVLRNVASAFLNHWSEAAPVHELKENPQARLEVESLKALNHSVAFCTHVHYTKFVSDDLSFLDVLRFDELEGTLLSIALALAEENSSETTISNLFNDVVVLRWIFFVEDGSFCQLTLELALGGQLIDHIFLDVVSSVVSLKNTFEYVQRVSYNILKFELTH